jgi:hypothetical protein
MNPAVPAAMPFISERMALDEFAMFAEAVMGG